MKKFRIAIFASGNGTNAEKIIQHFQERSLVGVALVLSNNPGANVLKRAEKYSIPAIAFSREQFLEGYVAGALQEMNITHIVLAGFLWLIPAHLIKAYPDRIINLHPALLPKFGGKGMYGLKVHRAVMDAAETETGITIHLVNEKYDEGKVLFQATCPVEKNFSAEQIAACVHELEYKFYPKIIEEWIVSGRIRSPHKP